MAVLYICQQGTSVHRDGERLSVKDGTRQVASVRLAELERVLAYGNINFTTAALKTLLKSGIPVSLLSSRGAIRGMVESPAGKNAARRMEQYRKSDDPAWRLEFSRRVVDGKVRNSGEWINRYHRRHPFPDMQGYRDTISAVLRRIAKSEDIDTLLGLEGLAARVHYHMMSMMIPPEWHFTGRNRRPPRDPVNSMLSLGYTLLCTEIHGVLESFGLDPYVGFYHVREYGRPSLACDIEEEFRTIVVDRLVHYLVKQGMVKPRHFFMESKEKGCRFREEPLKKFFTSYDRWINSDLGFKEPATLRNLIWRQADRLTRSIDRNKEYRPLLYGEYDVCCSDL